ncbi:MAG TPA: vitamin K epoxide reductase family protein [Gemmatimonadales bacterium]|jgi:uncharacterized membrane protein|nr:vitamin K epoxide reductase family protein [Gemmatimonadales bacterium]
MKYRMAVAALSLAGFFVALYLYLWKLGLVGTMACGTGACEAVQLSPYSQFLGVEVPLIGVLGYLALFLVSLLALQRPGERRWAALLLGLASGALLFTLYLKYVEFFVLRAVCRWCVLSAALVVLIFVAALLDWRRGPDPAPIR